MRPPLDSALRSAYLYGMRDRIVPTAIVASAGLALWLTGGLPAGAQEMLPELDQDQGGMPTGPVEDQVPEPDVDLSPDIEEPRSRLDRLFDDLARTDNDEWERVQTEIWRVWSRSGSASMDLLLRRADEAANSGDLDGALLFLDDLVRLAPDFAEAWNKRATVYFMRGDYGRSVADIERTLSLEPRHFGALSGLALILDRTGQKIAALKAWRRALEINPHLEGASDAVERLSPDVEGRDL